MYATLPQASSADGKSIRILIDGKQFHTLLHERGCMATVTQGRIHRPSSAGSGGKNRSQQDGHVKWRMSSGHQGSEGLKRNTPSMGRGVVCIKASGADGARTRDLRSDSAAL